MKKRKVIAHKNLPTKLPLTFTLLVCLIVKFYDPAEWVLGVLLTVGVIWWIGCIVAIIKEDHIDISKNLDE